MATQTLSGSSVAATSAKQMLESVEQLLERTIHGLTDAPAALREAMAYALARGGKRFRPQLCLGAATAVGGEWQQAVPAAAAVEIIHSYSLVHDDLPAMDDDDVRRGRPTCHVQFGEAIAILAGDALLTHAFAVLNDFIPAAEKKIALTRELVIGAGAGGMIGGQLLDITSSLPDRSNAARLADQIAAMKTGALIRAAVRMGGICGNPSAEQLAALDRYGDAVGMLFQLTDDLLDATGTDEQVGKRVNKDAAAGKLTLTRSLGIDGARNRAQELARQAIAALRPFGANGGALESLARLLATRQR